MISSQAIAIGLAPFGFVRAETYGIVEGCSVLDDALVWMFVSEPDNSNTRTHS